MDHHLRHAQTQDELESLAYLYSKLYLGDGILMKLDRASMRYGLEARSPFLDHNLVELSATIPSRLKLKGKTTKYVLKKTLEDRIPRSILNRPKKGFGIPIAKWIQGPLATYIRDVLSSDRIRRDGIFSAEAIDKLLAEHHNGKADHRKPIWSLLAFHLWMDRHKTGHPITQKHH